MKQSSTAQPVVSKQVITLPVLAQAVADPFLPVEVAIIADGKRSLAAGCALALNGHNVRVWIPEGNAPQECEIRERRAQVGRIRSRLSFASVTHNLTAALRGAEVVMVSAPATDYGALSRQLISHLVGGQTVVLSQAPLCAALQFAHQSEAVACDLHINIIEIGTLFDSVKIEDDFVLISGPRERVSVCGRTRNETRRGLAAASRLWRGLVPASNVLERGLTDVERLIKPVLRFFQTVRSEDIGRSSRFTPSASLVSVISSVGDEVDNIARAYALRFSAIEQMLADYTGISAGSLSQAVAEVWTQPPSSQSAETRTELEALQTLACEVGETFVPLSALAMLARLPVPMIDALIELSSSVTHRDLRKEGRGLDQLGLLGLDLQEIVETINL